MRGWLCVAMLWGLQLQAVVIVPAPSNFVLDGGVEEWTKVPPIVSDGQVPRSAAIWFARDTKGIVVAGLLVGSWLNFTPKGPGLGADGRVEIRLSVSEPFDFPRITFSKENCAHAEVALDERKACEEWRKEQIGYQENIRRLFTKKWVIRPESVEEVNALRAFDALTEVQGKALGFVRPSTFPVSKFKAGPLATSFEVLIPWESFPPADRLSLERIRIDATVQNEGFEVSTDLSSHVLDKRHEIPPVAAVMPPIVSNISPCHQPLMGQTVLGDEVPSFYFLTGSLEVKRVFTFVVPVPRFRQVLPASTDVSPEVGYEDFFSQELDRGEFLCGPYMSYRRGTEVRHFPFQLRPDSGEYSLAPVTHFPIKLLPDGTRLARYGPDRADGRSQKAGIFISTRVFALTPKLEATEVLSLSVWTYSVPEYEVEFSEDWKSVTEFIMGRDGEWTAEKFCLVGHAYQS